MALGASIGSNCHPGLARHVHGAFAQGLAPRHVRSAITMAEAVQQRAAEITTAKAAAVVESIGAEPDPPGGTADRGP